MSDPLPRPEAASLPRSDAEGRLARSRSDIAAWLAASEQAPGLRAAAQGSLPVQAARLALGLAARRQPWTLMALGLAAGASVAAARPWRWRTRPGWVLTVVAPLLAERAGRWLQRLAASDLTPPPTPPPPPTSPDTGHP